MLAFDSPWWVITAIAIASGLRVWWANATAVPARLNRVLAAGLLGMLVFFLLHLLMTTHETQDVLSDAFLRIKVFHRIGALAVALAALYAVWIQKEDVLVKWRASFLEFADSILIALLLVFCILRPFVIQAFFIPSGSMENTLLINDRILVNKFIYFFEDPGHGNIVVFRAPPQADPGRKDFIKRLMGVPGDRIAVHGGKVYRNGQELDEPYIKEPPMYNWPVIGRDVFAPGVLLDRTNGGHEWEGILEDGLPGRVGEVLVPPNCVLVMGDNRNDSNDSTKWHAGEMSSPFVPRENVLGQAKLIFWPLSRVRVLH